MTQPAIANLLTDLPRHLPAERFETLVQSGETKLERIISTGHNTAPGDWYDQPRAEWVMVVKGRAGLRFEDEPDTRILEPGDHLLIPPHARHRVEWTSAGEPTVWLALHIAGETTEPSTE